MGGIDIWIFDYESYRYLQRFTAPGVCLDFQLKRHPEPSIDLAPSRNRIIS
jgi:hypothetical protein